MFEPIGTAQIYHDHWTIITRVRKPEWDLHLSYIEKSKQALNRVCEGTIETIRNEICHHWNYTLKKGTEKIHELIEKIELTTRTNRRTKRGLINLGGRVMKTLFGTMDDEDSNKIHQKLDELEAENKHSLELAKQQVTVMHGTLKSMNETNMEMTKRYNQLVQKIKEINERRQGEYQQYTELFQQIHFRADISEIMVIILEELQQMYLEITDTLILMESINRRELSPLLLPSHQLRELYSNITKTHYGKETILDFPTLQKITKVDCENHEKGLIVQVRIPLTETLQYTINQIYMLPMQAKENEYYIYEPQASYFLNTSRSQLNFEIKETDFRSQCISINDTYVICNRNQPIPISPTRTTCLEDLFKGIMGKTTRCPVRLLQETSNVIVPMHQENVWIYWLHKNTTIVAQCDSTEHVKTLQGLGIIVLKTKCQYHMAGYLLPYKANELHNLQIQQPGGHMGRQINFERYQPINPTKNGTKKLEILQPATFNDHLKKDSESLEALEAELTKEERRRHVHVQMHTTTALTGCLLLMVLVIILFKVYQHYKDHHRQLQNRPVPAERGTRINIVPIPLTIPRRNELLGKRTGLARSRSTTNLNQREI